MLRERIAATGYVVSGERNHLLRSGDLSAVNRLRQSFVDRVTHLLPDRDAAAVLAAIAVGARHLVSQQQWERYARTGTSHLMAISGLHIGLAAGVAYILTLGLGGMTGHRGNHNDIATVASLVTAMAYAFVSGFEIPARRAALMIAFIVIASLWRRQLSPLLILCAACVAVIVLDPLATMAPGFKLSFAAVLVLIWLARRRGTHASVHWMYRPFLALRSLACLQVLLLLGLLPLTALIFQRVAFAAPVVNLIAVPLFSFVTVPLTLAGLVFAGPLQALGDQALLVAADSIRLLE
jgi:competence protein ComEC